MLGIAIVTLALVVGEVVTYPTEVPHPTDLILNEEGYVYNGTLNDEEEGIEIPSVIEPFENTNPSRVAAGELYQSDMLLSDEQWAALKMRKAIDSEQRRWTEGSDGYPKVPYVFQDSVDVDDVGAGLDHWMEHTCIKFEHTSDTEQPHLQFHIGSGCWSYVGMSYYNDGQPISIGSGCNGLGVIIHEVGHAMGFHHEQSRSDRDEYVTILMENVQDGKGNNFDKVMDNNYSVPYDYSSVMHYGKSFFSKNGLPTIVGVDPMTEELIGYGNGLSHRDKLLANRMYNCIEKWLTSCGIPSDPCLNGGYTGKDCICICPYGTNGTNCEEIVDDYYAQLYNPLSEKITTEKTITIETPMVAGTNFIKWIVPPTCKKVKLTFTSSNMYDGGNSCYYQDLTVKTSSSDMVGEIICPEDVNPGVILTSDTGIVIKMRNWVPYSYQKTLWEAEVTFENLPECTVTDPPTEAPTPAPTNPPTPAPTNPPTAAPTNPPTPAPTSAPAPSLACLKKTLKKTLAKGTSVTITSPKFPSKYKGPIKCGWKLKAPKKSLLTITCDKFVLKGKDKLQINKKTCTGKKTPPTITSKKLTIKFKTKKKSSAPGFRCTVAVVHN